MTVCDPEIYKHGAICAIITSASTEMLDFIVKRAAEVSGQRVDWHYFGGRAVVKALGNVHRVKTALRAIASMSIEVKP